MGAEDKAIDAKTMFTIKHDIKNQLSNIIMILEQLKHEMQHAPADQLDYLDMIGISAKKIDTILNSTD